MTRYEAQMRKSIEIHNAIAKGLQRIEQRDIVGLWNQAQAIKNTLNDEGFETIRKRTKKWIPVKQ